MIKPLTCFKTYDIRGKLGEELNEGIAYRIGRAYGIWLKTCQTAERHPEAQRTVVVGGDTRLTSAALKITLANGLMDSGVNVIDLGLTGTEEIYFATWHLGVNGGIEVTASHNPLDYNGMKLVRSGSLPISGETGLKEIQRLAENQNFPPIKQRGTLTRHSCLQDYSKHLLHYINPKQIKALKLVVNSGNGAAGHIVDALETLFSDLHIPITFIKVHHEPDGNFPNGIPNPLLPECRADTANAVLEHQADMGIAWDGDFDRCFLFDEKGQFIEGYYIVGLLAAAFLQKQPGATIIHDPRLTWNTVHVVETNGGRAVQSKTGHALMKEVMRSEDAIYGGEMSAHHYFRDFAYCDSGMIPWLLVSELLSIKNQPLSRLVNEQISMYPCSGEINFHVTNTKDTINFIFKHFEPQRPEHIDMTDGLSMAFAQWRFNLRGSNTEPVLRLNVESKSDKSLVTQKVNELSKLIMSCLHMPLPLLD